MNAPFFVRARSSYKGEHGLISRLFEGIALSAEQEELARHIITESIDDRLAVTLRNADGWERLIELGIARDATLRALLTSERDRALFDARSAELRRRQTEAGPPAGAAPVVLRVAVVPILGGTLEIVFRADGMSDEGTELASWEIIHAFRCDAEQMGLHRISAIADVLERRTDFATYARSVTRTFGRQSDGTWVPLPAA